MVDSAAKQVPSLLIESPVFAGFLAAACCVFTVSRNIDRRNVFYVDKVLRGVKPSDLPVEQPTKFEFFVNLKTAKQIGLTIPPNVLVRQTG
jgi:ABC-type uncharacterized transport system substrate-binding protein